MAGLLTNPMPAGADQAPGAGAQPQPQAPAAAPAAPAAAPGGQPQGQPSGAQPQKGPIGDGPVDPELLKKYGANCMTLVTQSLKQIAQMIQQTQDKTAALAHATVLIVMRVEDSLEQAGGQLNLSMTFNGGAECMSDIVDAMQRMGVYDFSQDEINSAFLQAANQYRTIRQQQGRIDQNMFVQKLQQLKQASANGTLDQMYPGMTQYAQDAQKTVQQAQKKLAPGKKAQGNAKPQGPADQGDGTADGSNDFPASMLKKKPNQIAVKPHYRQSPKKRKAPKQKRPIAGNAPIPPSARPPKTPTNNGAM